MSKITKEQIVKFSDMIDNFLAEYAPHISRNIVTVGRDAWTLAHRAGVTAECYKDRDIIDAHIQTVLEKIFPNVIFKDKKVY